MVLKEAARPSWQRAAVITALAGAFWLANLHWPPAGASEGYALKVPEVDPAETSGHKLAQIYCSACHVFPAPDLLDRKTWVGQTLPRMKIRMGLAQQQIDSHPEAKLLRATGIFPTSPMISTQHWNAIVEYYREAAPELPLPQDPRAEIDVGMKHFQLEPPQYRRTAPSTTMVKIGREKGWIYLGDATAQAVDILDGKGVFSQSVSVKNIPVGLIEAEAGFYLTSIGSFQPSDSSKAELAFFQKGTASYQPGKTIAPNLLRTTHAEQVDLDGDGQKDFLTCVYGNNTGRLSWFKNMGGDQYEEQVLIPKSGAVHAECHDFNGDKFPDIAALLAQETEAFYILTNDGKGRFKEEIVFQKHPLMGHTYFEMADFNGDSRLDFVITNGDNGEYASPLKRYHGIRVYLNQGGSQFSEVFFYPLNGAFKAMARDFDQDGDLDLAAISFFPDYDQTPEESFVYLENRGGWKFQATTFRECVMGRWLTMDAGDLDGDGDLDIVLGSFIHGPSPVPQFLMSDWQEIGPSAVILRNQLRTSK